MATFQETYASSAGFTFDSDKIEFSAGLAQAKQKSEWDDLQTLYKFIDNVNDESDNSNNGTPTSLTYVTEDIDKVAIFNGTTSKVAVPSSLSGATELTAYIRFKPSANSGTELMIFEYTLDGVYIYISQNRTGTADRISVLIYDGSVNWLDFSVGTMNDWHEIVVSSKESGTTYAWIDGGSVQSVGVGSFSSVTPNVGRIGCSRADAKFFNGRVAQFALWDVQKDTDGTLAALLWNSGSGLVIDKYYDDSPTLYKTAGYSAAVITTLDAFTETLGGGSSGSIAYQLSKDGITWDYYNSGWTTAGASDYNTAAVVNTNISSYDVTALDKIYYKLFFISDGSQQPQIDENQITYTANVTPSVNAGTNKSVFDNQSGTPFSDCTFSDPDGTVDFARYKVAGEVLVWTNIPQGGYATLLEAVKAFSYTFNNPGSIVVSLQVEDNLGATNEDTMTMTVNQYTTTFNVKDLNGNHIQNLNVTVDTGTTTSEDSPFTVVHDYGPMVTQIDKTGYIGQIINTTVDTDGIVENITLSNQFTAQDVVDAMHTDLRTLNIPRYRGLLEG